MTTNYLADELREITAALDDTPLMGQPIHRRLLALTETVAKLGEEAQEIRDRALSAAVQLPYAAPDAERVLYMAASFADYIRDGSRPNA